MIAPYGEPHTPFTGMATYRLPRSLYAAYRFPPSAFHGTKSDHV
jgi:hypothetical protein